MPNIFRLDNGLRVSFEPMPSATAAAFQVWVDVGSADETPSEIGLAHLHEHMLFKGTRSLGPGDVARTIESLGGEINAWTSFDQTAYHVVLAARHASEGLRVLSEAVRHATFDAGELSREIEVVCEEIKRSLDAPARRATTALFAHRYGAHPYGRPVIGFEASVRSHTRQSVLAFFSKHYRPDNMVLAAAGPFNEDALRRLIEPLFGGPWGSTASQRPPRPQVLVPKSPQVFVTEAPIQEAWVHVGFPAPAADHADVAALDLLALILGQGETSHLGLEVRRRKALARTVGAYAFTPMGPGLFAASLTTSPALLNEALAASLQRIEALRRHPVSALELSHVKALFEADQIYQRETVQGMAKKLGHYTCVMGDPDFETRYLRAIAATTPEDLQDVAQRTFDPSRAIVSALVPSGTSVDSAAWEAALQSPSRTAPTLPDIPLVERPCATTLRRTRPSGDFSTHRLPSGLTLCLKVARDVPLFSMRAVCLAGLRAEDASTNGISTLTARLLTKGTASLDAEGLAQRLDAISGSLSATAGRNTVVLRGDFLSKTAPEGEALFWDAWLGPTLSEPEFSREQKRLIRDIQSKADRPAALAFEAFAQALWKAHPYRFPASGTEGSVSALTPDQAQAFFRRHLSPAGTVVTVVGDVDVDALLLRAHARASDRPALPPRLAFAQETGPDAFTTVFKAADKAQAHLVLGFLGLTVRDADRRALEVLSTVLSGQSGRLFRELRDKQSLAYSVGSGLVEGLEPGCFTLSIGTSPDKVGQALNAMEIELVRLCTSAVSDIELSRAHEYLVGSFALSQQRFGARAMQMALDEVLGLSARDSEGYEASIRAVNALDVQRVAKRIIDFRKGVLAVVGPASLEALDWVPRSVVP